MGNDQGGPPVSGNNIGNSKRLSGTGDAQKRLKTVAALQTVNQFPNRSRLIPGRREPGNQLKCHGVRVMTVKADAGTAFLWHYSDHLYRLLAVLNI